MNKLKPEDVMRALECCQHSDSDDNYCINCPYYAVKYCAAKISAEALALLREKDAEIERLTAINKVLKDNNHQCHRLGYEDAITEFAERIKTFYHNLSGKTVGGSVAYHIDMIAKELKEVPNDKLQ